MKKTYSLATLGTIITATCLSFVPLHWYSKPEKDGEHAWITRYERSIVSYLFSKVHHIEWRRNETLVYQGVTRIVMFYGTKGKTTEVQMLKFSLIDNLFSMKTTDNFVHYREPNNSCVEHQGHEPPGGSIKPGSCADLAKKNQPHPKDISDLFAEGDNLFSQFKE